MNDADLSQLSYLYVNQPRPVGKYCLGEKQEFCIMFYHRPPWWHRFWMKFFLGWKWIDE